MAETKRKGAEQKTPPLVKQTVYAGEVFEQTIYATSGQVITWYFKEIYDVDISFSIIVENDSETTEKFLKMPTRCSTSKGEFKAEDICKILIRWDNSYSYFRGKYLEYFLTISPDPSWAGVGADFEGFISQDPKGKAVVKDVAASQVALAQSPIDPEAKFKCPDDDRFEVFLKWLDKGGAKYPNLLMKYYTVDYRGVHAKQHLKKDEIILEVPLNLIITSEVAKASEIGTKIRKSGCVIRNSHSWLAAFLLQEKYKPQSRWRPYLDILPRHYRHMPIFFDDEELKWLKGSFTLRMIEDRKEYLKSEYDNIVKYVPEFAKFHYLDFFWGRLAVITRIFGFSVNGMKTDGLVPMADMLNHKRPEETSWTFDQSRNAFTIVATRNLSKGAQIFDSYGRKCNSRFFVNYGFSLEDNEDNQVAMFFNLNKSDALYKEKVKLLTSEERRFQIPFEHKERVTRKCMSYLRVALATQQELTPLLTKSLIKIDPISVSNEAKVLQEVSKAAKEVLKTFDTTLEEDNKLLADKKITMNVRNCVIMRRGEKEILHAYIDLAERIKLVENYTAEQLEAYLKKEVYGKGPRPSIAWRLEMYFRELWVPLTKGYVMELEEMNNSLGE